MNFLKNILSTLLALIIFSLACLFIFLGIIGSLSDKQLTKVESNSVLHLKLNKPITELEVDNPFDEISFLTAEQSSIGLVQMPQMTKKYQVFSLKYLRLWEGCHHLRK
jgi:protease-4